MTLRVSVILSVLAVFLLLVTENALAEEKSAAEIAQELSNPSTPLSSLTSNFEYRTFKGSTPGADSQESWTYSFQPSFPFKIGSTFLGEDSVFAARPLIPVLVEQPIFGEEGFEDKGPELGDLGFDAVIGATDIDSGLILVTGVVGTLPTGTGSAGGRSMAIGTFCYRRSDKALGGASGLSISSMGTRWLER